MKQYLVDKNEILGPVTMEKPVRSDIDEYYADRLQHFNEHLASLPRYPIQGVNPWKDGDMKTEGIDFTFDDADEWVKEYYPNGDYTGIKSLPRVVIPVKANNYKKVLAETPQEIADMVTQNMDELERENEVKAKEDEKEYAEIKKAYLDAGLNDREQLLWMGFLKGWQARKTTHPLTSK